MRGGRREETYAVQSVGPGRFENGTSADGIIIYGFSEHRMLGVVWDADGSTADYKSVSCE